MLIFILWVGKNLALLQADATACGVGLQMCQMCDGCSLFGFYFFVFMKQIVCSLLSLLHLAVTGGAMKRGGLQVAGFLCGL
jgi:hypothetical protein